jgi:predicted ATPase
MRMPFLSIGPVQASFSKPLTFLVGENGSGKTTLLASIAAGMGIRPGGGGSFRETDSERESPGFAAAVKLSLPPGRRAKGYFLRAENLARTVEEAGQIRMATTGEWRRADEQSRGEGALSLLASTVDPSEGMLYLLDEPETGLSPARQMALLCQLDELHRDGRSQAIIATHSPILMSHPGAEILWLDNNGIGVRELDEVPHWKDMKVFMRNSEGYLAKLLG